MLTKEFSRIRSCPCGCGWKTRVGHPVPSEAKLAMDAVGACQHLHRVATLAPGIAYCSACMHWIGTPSAFRRLPTGDDRERHLYLYTDVCRVS